MLTCFFEKLARHEDGAAASEYAVLVAVVAVAVYAAINVYGLPTIFSTVNAKVTACINGTC